MKAIVLVMLAALASAAPLAAPEAIPVSCHPRADTKMYNRHADHQQQETRGRCVPGIIEGTFLCKKDAEPIAQAELVSSPITKRTPIACGCQGHICSLCLPEGSEGEYEVVTKRQELSVPVKDGVFTELSLVGALSKRDPLCTCIAPECAACGGKE
jgi:hypothetical protein